MTRRVALLGKPLRRRHSQVMHDAAFDAAGIDARYVLMEVDDREAMRVVAEARGPAWLGLGVTAPYKRLLGALCDQLEDEALVMGAVNNVVRTDDGRLIGINTDALGFRAGAELALGGPIRGAEVVVAGAGGAARAVVYACLLAGAARVTVANRTLDTAGQLVAELADVRPTRPTAVALDSPALGAALRSADLAVNATTVGMVDQGMTIDVDALPGTATVFDCVYVPAETALLHAARERGLRAANGSEMLIAQAAAAFERWTGIGGMAGIMRAAVAPLLTDPAARA